MAACQCSMLELQEQFIVEDIGTVYMEVPKKQIKQIRQDASCLDATMDLEDTDPDKEDEHQFSLKCEISTVSHAKNLYCLLGENGIRHRFVPAKDRILFDSKQMTSSAANMLDFVAYCKHMESSIVFMDPRKRLAFECPDFEEIYNISWYCLKNGMTDGRFYSTDMPVVRRRTFARNHQVRYTDYSDD